MLCLSILPPSSSLSSSASSLSSSLLTSAGRRCYDMAWYVCQYCHHHHYHHYRHHSHLGSKVPVGDEHHHQCHHCHHLGSNSQVPVGDGRQKRGFPRLRIILHRPPLDKATNSFSSFPCLSRRSPPWLPLHFCHSFSLTLFSLSPFMMMLATTVM